LGRRASGGRWLGELFCGLGKFHDLDGRVGAGLVGAAADPLISVDGT